MINKNFKKDDIVKLNENARNHKPLYKLDKEYFNDKFVVIEDTNFSDVKVKRKNGKPINEDVDGKIKKAKHCVYSQDFFDLYSHKDIDKKINIKYLSSK